MLLSSLFLFMFYILCLQSSKAVEVPTKVLNDGNRIPIIGLGTFSESNSDTRMLEKTIRYAIEDGYRHIDTAAAYRNEEEVGRGIDLAIKRNLVKREDLFVTTKLPVDKHAHNQVVPALRKSLKKLGLTYVDLYLIHTPMSVDSDFRPTFVDFVETWKGMEEAKELGLAKSIGVSNFNVDQLNRLIANCKVMPSINQIEVNPTHIRKTLVDHCKKLGIAVVAYTPLGFIVPRSRFDLKDYVPPPRINDPVLTTIAHKYKKTTTQVVLRYLIDRDLIPIPKSTNRTRLVENINVFDFKLTPEEVELINGFNKDQGLYGWH